MVCGGHIYLIGPRTSDKIRTHIYMMYPSLIDLSMHSLQKRCKHPITVRVFLMMPVLYKMFQPKV